MKKSRKQKGITLIALVVTIVVLLILAGITIGTLTSDNGVINEARSAKKQAEMVALEEQIEEAIIIAEQKYRNPNLDDVITEIKKIDTVTNVLDNGNIENKIGDAIVGKLDDYLDKTSTGEDPTLPTTNETKPYLPDEGSEILSSDINQGIVVKDSNQNEWVWIEVPRTTEVYPTAGLDITNFTNDEYKKIENDLKTYTNDYKDATAKDEYYEKEQHGFTKEEYDNHKKGMLKSVYQKGGFYIGRYEAGASTYVSANDNGARTAIIRQDSYPYNYVTCKNAQEASRRLAIGGRTTSLMFGVQWDLVLKYIEEKGTKLGETKEERKSKITTSSSSNWGNYSAVSFTIMRGSYMEGSTYVKVGEAGYQKPKSTNILMTTGATDRNSVLNIYDLAGNIWEWTLEYSGGINDSCSYRGGGYDFLTGTVYPANNRAREVPIVASFYQGFRPALW